MPTAHIEIRQDHPRDASGSPDLPPINLELLFEEKTTVRELIRRTVEENVNARLRESRRTIQKDLGVISQRSLTARQVAAQAGSGKIAMPSEVSLRRKLKRSQIDTKAQVQRAWEAFERAQFLLTVDGVPMESLDQQIVLGVATKIVFLRTASFLWLPLR